MGNLCGTRARYPKADENDLSLMTYQDNGPRGIAGPNGLLHNPCDGLQQKVESVLSSAGGVLAGPSKTRSKGTSSTKWE